MSNPAPLDAATLRAVKQAYVDGHFTAGSLREWVDKQLAEAAVPRPVALRCHRCRMPFEAVPDEDNKARCPECGERATHSRRAEPVKPRPVAEPEHARNDESDTLVARLRTLAGYFVTGPTTTLQGQPIDDDYRHIFNQTKVALREAADRLAAPVGWQPIATAPTDGTRVLLMNPDERPSGWAVQAGGWYEELGGWQYDGQNPRYSNAHQPTRWMPLPEVPHAD